MFLISYLLTVWLRILTVVQIFDFLSKVAANPADYGAPADRKADFQQLYNYIYALRA